MIPVTSNTSIFPFTHIEPIKSAQELVDEFLKINHLDKTFQQGNLTPLEMAVELKDLDLCKKVKTAQGRSDPDKPFRESLLLRAVSHSTDSIAIWLIEEGIDLRIEDERTGFNILHQAAFLGKIVVTETLIKKGMPINCISKEPFPLVPSDFPEELKNSFFHCTPLYFAVSNQHPQMVRTLLQSGADVNAGHTIFSPFNVALWNHCDDILQVFAEENCIDKMMVDGEPILHRFIETSITREEDLKKLLSLEINTNFRDSQGKPPIHLAIDLNCFEALKLLVERGADIHAEYNGLTALNYAFDLDRMNMFNYLLENDADPNIPVDDNGCTLLHIAAVLNNEELAIMLLRHKAHVDVIDIKGETPLFRVAHQKSHQIARLLLENGANPNHWNKKNESPLHYAVLQDSLKIADLLIKRGALIDARDHEENTPLHHAQSEEMVDFLLQANANVRVLNINGQTPLECLTHRSLITDHNFTHLKKKDAGLTEKIHKIKLLGHRFSLKGRWVEGFNTQFTFFDIAASWKDFLVTQPAHLQNVCKDLSARLLEAAKFKWRCHELQDDSQILEHLQNLELFLLPLGWEKENHAVVLTMMGRHVARGNRGIGAKELGLTIFEMMQPQHALAALTKLLHLLRKQPSVEDIVKEEEIRDYKDSYHFIKKEFEEKYKADAIQYFNNIFLEGVELKSLCHLQQNAQESGNCTWMAAKMGLRAALILMFLKESGDLQLAISQAKSVYKMWSQFDYERSLKNLDETLQGPLFTKEQIDEIFNELFAMSFTKNKFTWMEHILNARPQLSLLQDKDLAIYFLVSAKDRKTIDLLLSHGLDSIVEEQMENVLFRAIIGGNLPLIRYLVEERHCSLAQDKQKMATFIAASVGNKTEIASYLI